jgi:hypothetical protein
LRQYAGGYGGLGFGIAATSYMPWNNANQRNDLCVAKRFAIRAVALAAMPENRSRSPGQPTFHRPANATDKFVLKDDDSLHVAPLPDNSVLHLRFGARDLDRAPLARRDFFVPLARVAALRQG